MRKILLLLAFLLPAWGSAYDHLSGNRVIIGKFRFTEAHSGAPISEAEVEYILPKTMAAPATVRKELGVKRSWGSNARIRYKTDSQGMADIAMLFRYSTYSPETDAMAAGTARASDFKEFLYPLGALRVKTNSGWVDCILPHEEQVASVKIEWMTKVKDSQFPAPSAEPAVRD
ncbi:MAG: hypothetical protein QM760_09275 [Nibricoccus sp.]